MSETQEPKIEEQAEQALEAINSFEQKTEEIAKDNAELRAQMSEDETIALDKAQEIMEAASGKDSKEEAAAMREAAAVALVGETLKGFNLAHKVSRAFLAQPYAVGLEKFITEKTKEYKGSKRKSSLKNKLKIEFQKLHRNHIQFQESITLKKVTMDFFEEENVRPSAIINVWNDKDKFEASVKYIDEILGKPAFKNLLLALRFCVKTPMESLYRCFAIAVANYCHKLGGYDSRQFVKGLAKTLSTISVAAMASKSLPKDVFERLDMSIIEEFAHAVEDFDRLLGQYVSESK